MAEVITGRGIGRLPIVPVKGVIAKSSSKRPSAAEAASVAWRNLAFDLPPSAFSALERS